MSIQLPAVIATYQAAHDRHDVDEFAHDGENISRLSIAPL
jgi:hypothetical protein